MIFNVVSWQEVDDCCRKLSEKIHYPCDIMAVSRGGLCPSAILAYLLKVPVINLIELPPMWSSDRSDILIVDDICDTGQTFKELRQAFPNAVYVALYVKPEGKLLCDYWGSEVPQDNWVVFPWALHDAVNR